MSERRRAPSWNAPKPRRNPRRQLNTVRRGVRGRPPFNEARTWLRPLSDSGASMIAAGPVDPIAGRLRRLASPPPPMNDSACSLARPAFSSPPSHRQLLQSRLLHSRLLRSHLAAPLLVWCAVTVWAMSGGDFWLADRLYAWQGGRWALQNAYLTERLIHRLGRDASTAAWFGVLALWLVARLRPGLSEWRRPLAYLLLSTVLAIALVSALKSLTDIDCPWDLRRYGGADEFFGLFSQRPPGLGRGRCFPAGHASAGYAWVALYFFLASVQPRWRWFGLSVGLGLGLLFGVSQQLRGAHFLSHDLWTLAIAWSAALTLYLAMTPLRRTAPAAVASPPSPSPSAGR